MIPLKINNIQIMVESGTTLLQACNFLNIDIPKFCFHEDLQIDGNCRMCLVEVKNSPKPVVACAMPVSPNMEIFTNTPLVKKARESVLEFLLINHPLDCPICDQASECDLQDQTLVFGSDRSRFTSVKRSVEDKNFGLFVKTILVRCIQCTRCVRFARDIANIDNLGMVGRGNNSEISFYLSNVFKSEFSGNVIDLCPVGALTSKPYAFKARSWELEKKKIIDIFDPIGSNLIANTFKNQIIRILPVKKWIPNRSRFFFDSIKLQRIKEPLLLVNDKFQKISWSNVYFLIKQKILKTDPSQISCLIGNLLDLKLLSFIKSTFNSLGVGNNNINYAFVKEFKKINSNVPQNFINSQLIENLSEAEICLLININPKLESSYLSMQLNLLNKRNNLQIYSIGNHLKDVYKVKSLGLSIDNFHKILAGKHPICRKFYKKKLVIISDFNFKMYENYLPCKFYSLYYDSGLLNFSEIYGKRINNFTKPEKLKFFVNTDTNNILKKDNTFSIYYGHHFVQNAQNCNLLIPGLTFLEKKGLYLTTEGKITSTNASCINNTSLKSDLSFFKFLFFYLNKKKIRNFSYLYLYFKNQLLLSNFLIKDKFNFLSIGKKNSLKPIISELNSFYKNNIIEKTSKILSKDLFESSKKYSNF